MAINQISTANTFQEWLTTTSLLVAVANNLTDNTSGGFLACSSIYIQGAGASLNVRTLANINTLQANTANIANISLEHGSITGNGTLTIKDANVWANIVSVNVTGNLAVGGQAIVYNRLTAPIANIATANIANISLANGHIVANGNLTVSDINVTSNIVSVNVTGNLAVGGQTIVYNRLTAPIANIGTANIANISFANGHIGANGNLTISNINVTSNIVSLNVTGNLAVGGQTILSNRLTVPRINVGSEIIANLATANISNISFANGHIGANGNLTISNINVTSNIVSLNVSGNIAVGSNATISGNVVLQSNTIATDLYLTGTFKGPANDSIYSAIAGANSNFGQAIETSLAFAIALG